MRGYGSRDIRHALGGGRLRKVLLNELQFSVAIVLSREEVVSRFRVLTPDGDWTIFVPLPGDVGERQHRHGGRRRCAQEDAL